MTNCGRSTTCVNCGKGVPGKYAKRFHAGTNLVRLDPAIHKAFPNEEAVNQALRLVLELCKIGSRKTTV